MGIKKGDRVALVMPNIPQFVIAEFGIWKAGAVAACINPLYTEYEMEHALNECGAETVVAMTTFYNKVKNVQSKTKVKRVIAAAVREYLPFVLRLLFTLAKEKKEGHRIDLQPGRLLVQGYAEAVQGSGRPNVRGRQRQRHHPLHGRHHGPLQGRRGLPRRTGDVGQADLRLVPEHPARVGRRLPDRAAALPRLRQRRRADGGLRRSGRRWRWCPTHATSPT